MKPISKKIIVFFLLALFLAACNKSASSQMISSMREYADWADKEYPDITQNVARICSETKTVVYTNNKVWDSKSKAFVSGMAATCQMSENSYGIVLFYDENTVASAFSIYATSQGEVKKLLSNEGWR